MIDEPEVEEGIVFQASKVYLDLDRSIRKGFRGIVLEGGSRSTKTWSTWQRLFVYAQENPGTEFTISRAKMTWLRLTLLKDFEEITSTYGIEVEPEINFNRPNQEYRVLGCNFVFIGLDEPQKLHGRKQNVFWINEAIEATQSDFDQLEMRTTDFFVLDYNPSVTQHWIFKSVIPRPDVAFHHSTMLDNPFLEESIRRKILSYDPSNPVNIKNGTADETNWKIYGLGKRAVQKGIIYKKVRFVNQLPELADFDWYGYGLDYGYTNDPTALVFVGLYEGELWIDQIIYAQGLTNPEIAKEMKALGLNFREDIVGDSAEKKSNDEIKKFGFRVHHAPKGPDSVRFGIQRLQSYRMNVTNKSLDIKRELENYKWKVDKTTNEPTKEPIDDFNHALDAIRYFVVWKTEKKRGSYDVR